MPSTSPTRSPKGGFGNAATAKVYSFRTFTLLQLWEWATTFTHLSKVSIDDTIASSKRFDWSVQELNELEGIVMDIVNKKLCLASEHEARYPTAAKFGDVDDSLENVGEVVVIKSENHKSFGVPVGSVLTEVEGTRVLSGLTFKRTTDLLKAAPSMKLLRVKYLLPCIARASASVREIKDGTGDWRDCIVKMSDMVLSFEDENPVLPKINMLKVSQ